ncbi:hypothetical protein E2I00_010647 [Balaenoptera physalus]|uniref:Dolichyl-diphosphooligosaccharide--protein glycosyltransferase subunit TMEM258 n=1 Tax=Balaenoptera physalus TaxID=9770 RepID=A0A643CC13_BALPH|nr:hypothetical protein E2I00_010647 [Balaenoptera physalus]
MHFESANHAAEALGCEYEELNTATFKHHLRQIIEQVTSGPSRRGPEDEEASSEAPRIPVAAPPARDFSLMADVTETPLPSRSFSSHHLSMASIMVVDSPGFQNPRHQGKDRAATFEELCHNYAHERLQLLFYQRTFVSTLERFRESELGIVGSTTPHLQGASGALEKPWTSALRTCEQPLQCEIAHQLGHDPVRYDLTGWLHRAKPNLSALDAPQVLQQSKREELRGLFQARAKLSPVCRAVAGLEGTSQQAQQRSCTVRRTFASSLAAVKRKAPCSQIKLQMDALISVIRRSQLHFIHCLVPSPVVESRGGQGSLTPPQPGRDKPGAGGSLPLDIPALRVQLAGSYILEALRLHRAGYADHMGLTQFRRRFQVLDPLLMKKLMSAPERVDEKTLILKIDFVISGERKAVAELLQTLDLEKKTVAVGHSQASWSFYSLWLKLLVCCGSNLIDPAGSWQQLCGRVRPRYLIEACAEGHDIYEKGGIPHAIDLLVFLKAGVISRLEKQREKLVSHSIILFQAACKGFLFRQEFKKLKAELTALRQKLEKSERSRNDLRQNTDLLESKKFLPTELTLDAVIHLELSGWTWGFAMCQLLGKTWREGCGENGARHLVSTCLAAQMQKRGLYEIAELTTELADERFKGDVACQVLESERAERLRASREVQELKASGQECRGWERPSRSKYEQVQKNLGEVEKQLEEAQQKIRLNDLERSHTGGADEWQMRFDCAQMENEFLRKRLQQSEERLDSELASRNKLEQKLGELQSAYEGAKRMAQQLKRKCHHLTCDLQDTHFLLENQQSRNHELEKKQKKLSAHALGESVFEKGLREKVAQENTSIRCELGKLQQHLKRKEQETLQLKQDVAMLQAQKQELLGSPSLGENCIAGLKERLWKLESNVTRGPLGARKQKCATLRQRFELEIERMKQMHQKDQEDKEEEMEDIRQSCQKRVHTNIDCTSSDCSAQSVYHQGKKSIVRDLGGNADGCLLRQLEMQLEQEYEEKQMVLHEKQDLEGLIGTLCDQIGHRDFDVEKRLRRDLRRTHALLSDVQLLLGTMEDSKTSVSKEELEKVQSQPLSGHLLASGSEICAQEHPGAARQRVASREGIRGSCEPPGVATVIISIKAYTMPDMGFGGSYFDPTFDRRASANTLTTVLIAYPVADPVYSLRETGHRALLPGPARSRAAEIRFPWRLEDGAFLQQSETKCEDALKTQKALTADLESMHSELESVTRSKSLVPVDEQLYRLQFERADLLKRIDEDQDDLNDLMQKHKDLIAQVAQMRIEYLEQSTVDRAIVSRQEAVICDLENKTEFQKVQIKRFEVLVIRLRDSLMKMGEELSQAATAESQQRESSQYYQRRLEELKVDMEELAQREAEASRRCVELLPHWPPAAKPLPPPTATCSLLLLLLLDKFSLDWVTSTASTRCIYKALLISFVASLFMGFGVLFLLLWVSIYNLAVAGWGPKVNYTPRKGSAIYCDGSQSSLEITVFISGRYHAWPPAAYQRLLLKQLGGHLWEVGSEVFGFTPDGEKAFRVLHSSLLILCVTLANLPGGFMRIETARILGEHPPRHPTEKYVEELTAVRQTLQTDLETSIRRIADLQAALEEVVSSDSDTESNPPVHKCLAQVPLEKSHAPRQEKEPLTTYKQHHHHHHHIIIVIIDENLPLSRQQWIVAAVAEKRQGTSTPTWRVTRSAHESSDSMVITDNVSILSSQPEGSLQSWLSCTLSLATDTVRTPSRQSATSSCILSPSIKKISAQDVEAGSMEIFNANILTMDPRPEQGVDEELRGGDSMSFGMIHGIIKSASSFLYIHGMSTAMAGTREKTMEPHSQDGLSGEGVWPNLETHCDIDPLHLADLGHEEGQMSAASPVPVTHGTSSRSTIAVVLGQGRIQEEAGDGARDAHGRTSGDKVASPLSLRRGKYSHFGDGEECGVQRKPPERRCLESSLEDAGCPDLGKEPLVFQNRQFAHLTGDPLGSDAFSWKVPSLNYERKTQVGFDDFLPAIRKPEMPTSLARAARDGQDGSQRSGVHFETEVADRGFLSGITTVLKKSPEPKEDPAHLSDSSSSSSSIVSFKSADSIKSRPRIPRLEGDGAPD